MSSCEKCWRDAWGDPNRYQQLISERAENPCTAEEQAGLDAGYCEYCKRKTVHQHIHRCVNIECVSHSVNDKEVLK